MGIKKQFFFESAGKNNRWIFEHIRCRPNVLILKAPTEVLFLCLNGSDHVVIARYSGLHEECVTV